MAIMTESILRGYLYAWLASVVSTLWVGVGGTRPAGRIAFVWHMENNARPATPLLEGRLSTDSRIGRDIVSPPSYVTGHVGEQTITGDREFMLYLEHFGPGALDTLKTIRNATNDLLLIASLQQNHIAVVECMPVMDAHEYLDSMPEDRATMDMAMRYVESWISTPGIIEHANITGKVDGIATKEISI